VCLCHQHTHFGSAQLLFYYTPPSRSPGPPKAACCQRLKTLALSLDPAMRGWMNEGKSYIPPVGIGEVMRAGGVGKVQPPQPEVRRGRCGESAGLGVQEYWCPSRRPDPQAQRLAKIDLRWAA
jgi:NADPH-dependent curcumin reductase CurA